MNAHEQQIDESDGPWATICDDHGTICNHQTREVARYHLSCPWEWCQACRDLLNPPTNQ